VFSFTLRSPYTGRKSFVTNRRLGRPQGRSGRFGEGKKSVSSARNWTTISRLPCL
jgi:hypothetical protein